MLACNPPSAGSRAEARRGHKRRGDWKRHRVGERKNSKAIEDDMRVTAKQISMCGNRW